MNSCPPFDIVIDGLNVAKMFPKGRESQNVSMFYFVFPSVEIIPVKNQLPSVYSVGSLLSSPLLLCTA